MTGHRDPIEDWLSRDVDVLPPPAGAFQRVRRRARRRKAIQAASAAAGVAIIIAAGISVPALTGNLFQGTGPAKLPSSGPTASSAAASRTPNPSSSVPGPALAGPALSTAGSGPAPPPGFRPSSVTFAGSGGGELGAVLGQASCGTRTCTAMAGTRTYGSHWTKIGAPPAGPAAVSQIRFADADNGWAFGPALWATHSGGTSWQRISVVTGRVVDLATVDNEVLAVTATGCQGAGDTGCAGFDLYAAAVTSNHFSRVMSKPRGGLVTPGGLQLQPSTHAGYLVAGSQLYSGALDGGGWSAVPPESNSTPGCLDGRATGSPAVLAPAAPELYAACATGHGLELYRSGSSGRTWQAAGVIPAAGTATSLAVSPARSLVLATTRGLYYSPNPKTWRPAGGNAAGVGFRYVGMTTDRLGVAVPASASAGTVYVTTDGGSTWQSRRISQ